MLVRVMNGTLKRRERINMMATGGQYLAEQIGVFTPKSVPLDALSAGQVGFVITGIKELGDARVGDMITNYPKGATEPLPGFRVINPVESSEYESMRDGDLDMSSVGGSSGPLTLDAAASTVFSGMFGPRHSMFSIAVKLNGTTFLPCCQVGMFDCVHSTGRTIQSFLPVPVRSIVANSSDLLLEPLHSVCTT